MTEQNNGGPAFPIPGLHNDADFNGVSLRDYFATNAPSDTVQELNFRHLSRQAQERLTGLKYPQKPHPYKENNPDEIAFQLAELAFAREALATTEPAVNQQLTTEPIDERAAFESEMMRRKSWTVYEFQPHPHRGEYPHPDYLAPHANTAWAGWQARAAMAQVSDINVAESFTNDTKDAERYRWLADSNNYYEAINLISDGSLTEDALGKAIDAAMAKGVK